MSNDSPTVLGQTTSLTASVTGGTEIIYDWDLGDGLLASDAGASLTHTYATTGLFTVTATAHNSLSNDSAATVVTVEEIPPDPITGLSVSNDSPTVLGQTTSLTASVTGGGEITYDWDLGDGLLASDAGTSLIHTYTTTGLFTVTATAHNSVSSESAITVVTVEEIPPDLNLSPLEASGLTPLWVENFTNGSIDKMQYTWARGDHAALRSFVIPGAMYFGQEGAPEWPWVEQEINNFKEYNGEPLPNTLEFDLLNPSEGHARISLRPRRLSDFAHIYVGVDNNKTRISYRFLLNGPTTTIYYDEPTGSSLGWAHVTVSYSQYESAGATYGHYVIAINEEVHEISATSSITSPNWLTYWNSTPEADGWSIEYNGFETTTTGRYLANLRAYSGFISKPEMEERLEGRLDDYLADIPDPREYDGPTKAFEVHKLLEMHGPNALAYTQQLDGLSIRFDGSLSSGWKKITAYDWTFGDGESDSGRLVEHTYAQPGTYKATLTVKNKHGTDKHAFTVVIE